MRRDLKLTIKVRMYTIIKKKQVSFLSINRITGIKTQIFRGRRIRTKTLNHKLLLQIEDNKNNNHSKMVTINKKYKHKEEVDLKRQKMNMVETIKIQNLIKINPIMMQKNHHSEELGVIRTITIIKPSHQTQAEVLVNYPKIEVLVQRNPPVKLVSINLITIKHQT